MLPAVVLDNSACINFFFDDEEDQSISSKILSILEGNGQFFVPSLFWFESGNALITAKRRKRLDRESVLRIEDHLRELPIATDPIPTLDIRMRIREMAEEKGLSFYDASYLELARRLDLPLLTLDERLERAAKS